MPTTFFSTLSTETKPQVDGIGERDKRYVLVNSRNQNRKIIRSGSGLSTQLLGIAAPTVAPTAAGGAGADLFYRYVYVNEKFTDPLALEADDPWIRSNSSPVRTTPSQTTPPTLTGTVSTDPQVTHLWLYVAAAVGGPFYRLTTGYSAANSGTPTWTGVISVPTAGYLEELDNYVPDTCRTVSETNGFFNYAGFVPITGNGTILIGGSTVTVTTGTMYDGVLALFFQFDGDTTGGPNNNGIFIVNYATSTTLNLVNADGTVDTYDGPANKTAAPFRIWRDQSIIQISKRYNPDAIPGIIDLDYLIRGSGPVSGIAKPTTGFAIRYHYNGNGKKSVEIADFTQGLPPRRYPTSSPYAMSNPKAWTAAGGRLFYWDAQAGAIEDRGATHIPITQISIPNLVRSLNKTATAISEMCFDETRNLLFLAVAPSGYTKNYYLIVYNLTTNSWNLWFMLPDVNTMARIEDANKNVLIYMGSTNGSITTWPSVNFNEAVGSSQSGVVGTLDDSTHLTVIGTPFPTTGDLLKDRWVMTWNDSSDLPTYQFARISTNTSSRLTLDTFIGPNSTVAFSPIPSVGDAYWVGPIQSILGPNWDFNSIPDEDGKLFDLSVTTSGLDVGQVPRLSLFKNFETAASVGTTLIKDIYSGGTNDADHQSFKSGAQRSIEATGVTGWQITDNNEAALSIKAIVRRVKTVSETLNRKQ